MSTKTTTPPSKKNRMPLQKIVQREVAKLMKAEPAKVTQPPSANVAQSSTPKLDSNNKTGKRSQKKTQKKKDYKPRGFDYVSNQDLPQFGNPNDTQMEDTISDDSPSFSGNLDYDRVKSAVEGIVSSGISLGGDSVLNLDHGLIVQFLVNYLYDEAMGNVHPFPLASAPAVFWDMCHAVSARKRGKLSYVVADTARPSATVSDTSHDGAPFGLFKNNSTDYCFVDPTTAYVENDAFLATRSFFVELSDKLVCQNYGYRKILANDTSTWVFNDQVLGDALNTQEWKCNGISHSGSCVHKHYGEISCHWLACVGLVTTLSARSESHFAVSYVSPGSIVAHRIYRKYKGYEGHKDCVIVKPVPAVELMLVIDALFFAAINRYPNPADGGNTPTQNLYVTAGLSKDDARNMWAMLISRHFARYSAIAVNMFHNTTRYFTSSTGSNPMRTASGMWLPTPVELNLASLYPYHEENRYFYPMLWYDLEFLSPNASWFKPTGGFFSAAWSMITNIGASKEVAIGQYTLSKAMATYSTLVQLVQPYIPLSKMKWVSQFNAARCTAVYDETNKLICVTSKDKIYEDVRPYLDQMILPCWNIDTVITIGVVNDNLGQLQAVMQEMNNTSAEPNEVRQYPSVTQLLLPAQHQIGGIGVQEGEYKPDRYAIDERKNRNKNYNISPKYQDIIKKGLETAKSGIQMVQYLQDVGVIGS